MENRAGSSGNVNISECADKAIIEDGVRHPKAEFYKRTILDTLQESFYKSSTEERLFFGKLARTYSLLFCLKANPQIINFFQDMAREFHLYVGSDLLVKALSERYVRKEDQRMRTLLKLLVDIGAKLILSEPVLEEIQHHLWTTDLEFNNYFAGQENLMTNELIRNCPKILIRAYFYSRRNPSGDESPPNAWKEYLNQFCHPTNLRSPRNAEALKRYLMSTFSMQYENREELKRLISTTNQDEDLKKLAEDLTPEKSNPQLAENDATMALAIYGRRQESSEGTCASEFGFMTWWLTGETSIIQHTMDIVRARGSRYMMRPEFLLNFIALVPRVADVRKTYQQIFPSLLGIKLSNRIREDVYTDMMTKINEAKTLEPGRIEALIAEYSDHLKTDFNRVYDHNFTDNRDSYS